MIQFNLLPDIKLEYIKAKRTKRTVMLTSSLVTTVVLALFILLFVTVNVFQKQHMNDISNDIATEKAKLDKYPDLDKILTIQSQLGSITALHETKPVTGRLFVYLPQIVPQAVSLTNLKLDFETSTIELNGSTDSLGNVNKFVDTLKFTQYTNTETKVKVNAFSEVVLDGFSKDVDASDFTIKLKFDPYIFDSANSVALNVPEITSSRSVTEKPADKLFINKDDTQDNGEPQ